MGPPETPAQCLCPLEEGDSSRVRRAARGRKIKERKLRDLHATDIDLDNNSGTNYNDNNNRNRDPSANNWQSPFSPSSSPPQPTAQLRRASSTTFYDGGDAQQCIDACRQGFFDSLSTPSSSSTSSSSSLPLGICSLLSSSSVQQELWQLYWCDSAFCGVWIDANGGTGQDPNVDLIINQCQNFGYSSIYDPGPPPSSYYCSSLLTAGPSGNPCRHRAAAVATETKTETATPKPTMTADAAGSTTLATQHRTQRLTTASGSPPLAITATSLTLGSIASGGAGGPAATGPRASNSNDNDGNSATPSSLPSGPSAGVKGAIVVVVVVLVLLVAGIVFYFLRRRRNNNMLGQEQSYQHRGGGSASRSGIGSRGGGGSGPGRRPSYGNTTTTSNIGLTARLRQQGQMLFYPGHGRGGDRDDVPTPLISPANSCNSVRGVSAVAGMAKTQPSPKRAGTKFFAVFRMTRKAPSSDPRSPPRTAERAPRSILPSFLSRRQRERSISPPLTSLSPPPSPTQMSARGRPDIDLEEDGRPGHNKNRASAANSGSSYYGYYGYNGNFVPYYFPSSPICAPTTNKLEPRREKTPNIRPSKLTEQQKLEQQKHAQQKHGHYDFQKAAESESSRNSPASQTPSSDRDQGPIPPLPPLPHSIFSTHVGDGSISSSRGLRSSYGSYSTASSTIIPATNLYGNAVTTNTVEPMMPLVSISAVACTSITNAAISSTPGGTVSPARPKRPHEGPLEIPDLVMPDPPPQPVFNPYSTGGGAGRSFSMPATAFSVTSGSRRAPPRPIAKDEPILSRGPPPNRSLPQPPSPPQTERQKQDDMDSIESLELPPLLMRDDGEEDGDTITSWTAPRRSTSYSRHSHNHRVGTGILNNNGSTANNGKPAAATASFSSTVSTASILSSSTADTATTAATVTSLPSALSMSMPMSMPMSISTTTPTSTPPPRQPFSYASPSTASSSLTIRPAAPQNKDADNLFPSRTIPDSGEI